MRKFDYSLDYANLDLQKHPELFVHTWDERGVLLIEPYKSIILPYWKFKTPEIAKKSAEKIYSMFLDYIGKKDVVGASISEKFLHMGYTRAMRYYHHSSGQKYIGPVPDDKKGQSGAHGRPEAPLDLDPEKKKSAEVFYPYWQKAKKDERFVKLVEEHKEKYG